MPLERVTAHSRGLMAQATYGFSAAMDLTAQEMWKI